MYIEKDKPFYILFKINFETNFQYKRIKTQNQQVRRTDVVNLEIQMKANKHQSRDNPNFVKPPKTPNMPKVHCEVCNKDGVNRRIHEKSQQQASRKGKPKNKQGETKQGKHDCKICNKRMMYDIHALQPFKTICTKRECPENSWTMNTQNTFP